MEPRPRLLAVGPLPGALADALAAVADVVPVADAPAAAEALRGQPFAGVVADPAAAAAQVAAYHRGEVVLAHLDKGVGVLDLAGVVTWANPAMRALAPAGGPDPVGLPLMAALGATTLASDVPDVFATARRGLPVSFRLYRPADPERPYLDVSLRPVVNPAGQVEQQVVIVRNVTPEVEQQRKLDALHAAGRELAGLDPDQLAEMNVPTRVELLEAEPAAVHPRFAAL